jgi:hypothetical protein
MKQTKEMKELMVDAGNALAVAKLLEQQMLLMQMTAELADKRASIALEVQVLAQNTVAEKMLPHERRIYARLAPVQERVAALRDSVGLPKSGALEFKLEDGKIVYETAAQNTLEGMKADGTEHVESPDGSE